MKNATVITQDEQRLAGVAHGSILLGIFTNGIGGIATTLIIYLTQKEKSAYVAAQAFQALVYQAAAFALTLLGWFAWGIFWMILIVPPLIANPEAYETQPPPGIFVGLGLMICPLLISLVTLLYGLWGAFRCFGGRPFKYVFIGNWLERNATP
jgi:uncharacterized Tic20 family protein